MKPRKMPSLVLKAVTCWLLALMMNLTAGAQTMQTAPGLGFSILAFSTQTQGFREVGLQLGALTEHTGLISTETFNAPLRTGDPEKLREASSNKNLTQGVLVGVFLVQLIFSLFIFLTTRDVNYIYYILFIASYLMFHLTLTGYSAAYLWPTAPHWNSMALSVFMASTGLFACLLTNSFLRLKEFSRRAWILVIALAVGCVILVPLALFLPYGISFRLGTAITGTVALTALLFGYWRWWRGAGFVRYYCIAWTSVLIAIGTLGAHKTGFIASKSFLVI